MPLVVIIGIGSDIGRELSQRFIRDGWDVVGTIRHLDLPNEVAIKAKIVSCDLSSKENVEKSISELLLVSKNWNLIIVAAGTMNPIGKFWDVDADDWEESLMVNLLGPLRIVRRLYAIRNKKNPSVCFFSGAGTNNSAPSYSAYSASKLTLIKMCELLDSESEDTSFFIIGPGIVRTKIHQETLRAGVKSGENLNKINTFLESKDQGVSFDKIYSCINWCKSINKKAIGGRNISLVHDAWGEDGKLSDYLHSDNNLYKLRRYGNDINWLDK